MSSYLEVNEPRCEKTGPKFWVSDQARYKAVCTTTEDGLRLKISDSASRGIELSV